MAVCVKAREAKLCVCVCVCIRGDILCVCVYVSPEYVSSCLCECDNQVREAWGRHLWLQGGGRAGRVLVQESVVRDPALRRCTRCCAPSGAR